MRKTLLSLLALAATCMASLAQIPAGGTIKRLPGGLVEYTFTPQQPVGDNITPNKEFAYSDFSARPVRWEGNGKLGTYGMSVAITSGYLNNDFPTYPELQGMTLLGAKVHHMPQAGIDNYKFVLLQGNKFWPQLSTEIETVTATRVANGAWAMFSQPQMVDSAKMPLWVECLFDVTTLNDSTKKPIPLYSWPSTDRIKRLDGKCLQPGDGWAGGPYLQRQGFPVTLLLFDPNNGATPPSPDPDPDPDASKVNKELAYSDHSVPASWNGSGTLGTYIISMGVSSAELSGHKTNPELQGMTLVGARVDHLPQQGIGNYQFSLRQGNTWWSYSCSEIETRPGTPIANGAYAIFKNQKPILDTEDPLYVQISFDVTQLNDSTKKPVPFYSWPSSDNLKRLDGRWLKPGDSWDAAPYIYRQGFPITLLLYDPNGGSTPQDPETVPDDFGNERGIVTYQNWQAGQAPSHAGSGELGDYSICMALYGDTLVHIYENHPELSGFQLVGARAYGLPDKGINNYHFWTDYDGVNWPNMAFGAPAPNGETVPGYRKGDLVYGVFKKPVTVSPKTIMWVGCDFTVTELNDSTKAPIPMYKWPDGRSLNDGRVKLPGNSWDAAAFLRKEGVPMTLVLKMDQMPDLSAKIWYNSVGATYPAQRPFSIPVNIANQGADSITSIDFEYAIGSATNTGHIDIAPAMATIDVTTIHIPISQQLELGSHSCRLTITKVNGQPNPNAQKSITIAFEALQASPELPEGLHEASYTLGGAPSYLGKSAAKSARVATKFADPNLAGMKIVGVRLYNMHDGLTKNFKIWNSSALTNTPNGQTVNGFREGTTVTVSFPNPITLTAAGTYIGYDMAFDQNCTGYEVPCTPPAKIANSFYISTDGGAWNDVSEYGVPCITLLLQGTPTANSLKPAKLVGDAICLPGKPFSLNYEVVNYGANPVQSIEYSYQAEGKTVTGTKTLDTPLSSMLTVSQPLTLDIQPYNTPGSIPTTLTITKVNGQSNGFSAPQLAYNVNVAEFATTHRPILEEATGTACAWCPRGMVALDAMADRYPDFIAAAYHRYNSTDPMYAPVTMPWAASGGFPSASIDRGDELDPFYGNHDGTELGIEQDYLTARDLLAPADIQVQSTWNQAKDELQVEASAKFAFIESGKTYKVGYIVTIDSLSHPDLAPWKQASTYTGTVAGSELLSQIARGTFNIHMFNHVVIEGSTYKGVSGSLPTSNLTVKQSYSHSQTLSLKGNELLEKPENVKVIALLLDNTGRVRNASVCRAGESSTTSVSDFAADPDVDSAVYYDLTGRRVLIPGNGIFIRVQNGHATKIRL